MKTTNSNLKNIKDYLDYNPETGIFMWIKRRSPNQKLDIPIKIKCSQGYLLITFNKIQYKAHRIAWYFVYGKLPEKDIDHINGIKDDNRICNLREVTKLQNNRNYECHRKGAVPGVHFCNQTKKWKAQYHVPNVKKTIGLGYFFSKEEAIIAVKLFESQRGII